MTIRIPMRDRIGAVDQRLSPLSPLEAEIAACVHNAGINCVGLDRTAWTAEIKRALRDLALDNGWLPWPNELVDNHVQGNWQRGGQWLCDLVWVAAKRNRDGSFDWRYNRGLVLACESEWDTGEYKVLEDFLKLTCVQADLRLFIYTDTAIEDGRHPVDVCRRSCTLSRGSRYLTIGFPGSPRPSTKDTDQTRVDAWIS